MSQVFFLDVFFSWWCIGVGAASYKNISQVSRLDCFLMFRGALAQRFRGDSFRQPH